MELTIRADVSTHMRELKQWLAQTRDEPAEDMNGFFAARVDTYEAHMSVWDKAYGRVAELTPGDCGPLLDLGCGTGLELASLYRRFPALQVTGIDLSETMLGQLREIVENYHPDSLFIDIFGMTVCYCPTCRALYRERYGYDLPETPEGLLEHNNDVVEYLDDEAERMLDDVRALLHGIDPTLAITVNFSSHYPKRVRDKLDYMFTEPWAGNWLSGAYDRDTSAGKPVQLGPGDVSQVYNYQPESIYELAAAEIARTGGGRLRELLRPLTQLRGTRICFLLYAAWAVLSAACSEYEGVWLGLGRYEGLLFILVCVAGYWAVSSYGRWDDRLLILLGAVLFINLALGLLQYAGAKHLGLFPEGLYFHYAFLI